MDAARNWEAELASIWEEAEEAAERMRVSFWQEGVLPVDPVAIARELGITVRQAELPAAVSAALVKRPGEDPVILVQQGDHANRQRFSCAHEIGHFVRHAGEQAIEYIDFRDPKSATGEDMEEQFANRFAAALLMPTAEVFALANIPVWQSSQKFGVSPEAMKIRRDTLGL